MRHSRPSITGNSQQGMSLISLMIGVSLSIFGMLVTTSMHARHQVAVNSLQHAIIHNRLLITAMSTMQKEVQSAGYGITGADQNDIITLFVPATSTVPASRTLLWRYRDSGAVVCRGIRESGFFTNNIERRVLNTITSPLDCDETTPLQNFAWSGVDGHLGQWDVRNELVTHINNNDTLFSFGLLDTTCSTSGGTQTGRHLLATISAPNNAELNGSMAAQNSVTACLINIQPI